MMRMNSSEKREWDQACADIARVLQCDPEQIERMDFHPHNMHIDVVIGGKSHRVGVRRVAEAKMEAIRQARARAREAEEAIRRRETPASRWASKWGTMNAEKPFMVESDGTIDLNPTQWRVVKTQPTRRATRV